MDIERDFEARSDHCADPSIPLAAIGKALTDEEAVAGGHDFLVAAYGSIGAVDQKMRRGRRTLGDARTGASPVVRGRISEEDFAAFKELEKQTGQTQAELVRESIHLLIERHRSS